VQDIDVTGQSLQTIEVPRVQLGMPSELLTRRPDLVKAEANLRRERANVDLVKTDLFSQISLIGGVNASSTSLTELVSDPATLNLENSLNNYRRSVIGAFNEVEVLLSNVQLLEAQVAVAPQNLEAAEESFRIAQMRYHEGVTDFQTVLTSQNTLFSTRISYLEIKLLQLNTMVGLFQALGSGWQVE